MKGKETERKLKAIAEENKLLKEQAELQKEHTEDLAKQLELLAAQKTTQQKINDESNDYARMLEARYNRLKSSNDEADRLLAIQIEEEAIQTDITKIQQKKEKLQQIIKDGKLEEYEITTDQSKVLREELNYIEKSYEQRKKILEIQKNPDVRKSIQKVKNLQEKYNDELEKSKDTAEELAKPFKSITSTLKGALGPIGGLFSDVFDKIDKDAVESIQRSMTGKLSGTKGELDSATSKLKDQLAAADVDAKDLGMNLDDVSARAVDTANSTGNIGTSITESTGRGTSALSKMKTGLGSILTAGNAAFKGLIAGARTLAGTLMANPIFLIAGAIAGVVMLVKKFNDLRDRQIDIARQQGLSVEKAKEYQQAIVAAEKDMSRLGRAVADVDKAEIITKFSDTLETNLTLTNANVNAVALLKKQFSLTNEEAFSFATATAMSGQDLQESILSVRATVDALNDQTNMGLRYADVMKTIGKLSKSTLANYRFQIPLLTQAIAKAKQFGLELEETSNISKSLLDISTSIEDEMVARVVTGKNLNFNEARHLALLGKNAEAVESMVKQIGKYEDIQHMLPLQQEALAKAMGMTRDQLIDAVTQQDILSKMSGETVDYVRTLTDEQLKSFDFSKYNLTEQQKAYLLTQNMQQKAAEIQEGFAKKGSAYFDAMMVGNEEMQKQYKAYGVTTETDRQAAVIEARKEQFDKDYGPGALEKQAAQMSGTTNVPGTKQMTPEAKKFKETSDYIDSLIEPITRFRLNLFAPGESNDFISRPGQPIQKFNKDDIIIGATSPFGGDNTGDSDMLNELKKQNELLQAILASTNQPTLIQIGNRTIEEIGSKTGMRRNFTTTGIGNTYGKTLPGY